ncbi:hypothetical protein [Paenibacillus herberti]|uniref:Uncharacterized protein n=1 Tax=Paenibacillus herberti TaxID=1619309 RepID=A0A229NWZ7_9BACL|nr:hypothetical protein [Paenibacillus herberti]OXM14139.1 hypothetical protein CGZ75_14280 [Paenibacillus herberti]
MYEILISVIACYGTAAVVVHLAKRSAARKAQAESHYILMTQDDESQLEHCIRSLQAHSRRSGTSMRITIWDQGSKDDTVLIARYCGNGVSWVREPSELRSPQETVSTAEGKLASDSAEGKLESVPAEGSFERESLHDFDGREPAISATGLSATKLDDSQRELIESGSEGGESLEATLQPRGEGEADPGGFENTQGHGAGHGATDGSKVFTSHGGTPLRSLSSEGKEKILWSLRFYGIISESDQPVMIDLKNIEDLSKLPFRATQDDKGYGR